MRSLERLRRKSEEEKLPSNVRYLSLTSLFTDISSVMVLTLLPLFMANVLGVRTNIIGLIEGLAESTSSLLKVISGTISDRINNRKRLAVFGYSLSAIIKPLFYFVTTWYGVLFVRFADRVGKGVRTAPRDALIAGSVKQDRRGVAFGLHRAADTLGAFIGLGIALVVVLLVQAESVTLSQSTFQAVVLVSIFPAFLAILCLVLGVKDVQTKAKKRSSNFASFGQLSGDFKIYLGIVALFTLGNSADAFLILRAQERGLSVVGILLMLLSFNFIYTLISTPAGRLSDRWGRLRVLKMGWAFYALIYLGFALASQIWQVWGLYLLYGVYYGLVQGAGRALVADLVDSDQLGTAYGYYNAIVGFVILPGNILAGVLWEGIGSWGGFGPGAPFFVGALLAFLSLLLIYVWQSKAEVKL